LQLSITTLDADVASGNANAHWVLEPLGALEGNEQVRMAVPPELLYVVLAVTLAIYQSFPLLLPVAGEHSQPAQAAAAVPFGPKVNRQRKMIPS
jgi:hypothetical protein